MLQYLDSVQATFEKHVLLALARVEEGHSTAWQTVEKQLLAMSPSERRNLLMGLKNRQLLKVIDDPQGNFVLSLTDEGRSYMRG